MRWRGRPRVAGTGLARVLVVEGSLRETGGLRVALGYARRWAESGLTVDLAIVQHASDHALAVPAPVVTQHLLTRPGTRFRTAAPGAILRLCLLARRADVVLSGSEEGNGLLTGWLAARLTATPFAVLTQLELGPSIDTWVPRPLRRPTRWIHARCDASICVSDSTWTSVVDNGLPPDRAHVVHNGVDAAAIRAAAAEPVRAPGGTEALPTIVACGRLAEIKGFSTLLEAHARVRRAGLPHRVLILGEGPARADLEAQADRLGVTDTVSLPGFVASPYASMAGADLFVLASESEGTPLVLLEAMVLGLPIVSTRCGSAPESVLEDGRCGRLIDVGSVDQLAEAITDHLRDPAPLRARAARAVERAEEYDVDRASARARDVLAAVVSRPPLQWRRVRAGLIGGGR